MAVLQRVGKAARGWVAEEEQEFVVYSPAPEVRRVAAGHERRFLTQIPKVVAHVVEPGQFLESTLILLRRPFAHSLARPLRDSLQTHGQSCLRQSRNLCEPIAVEPLAVDVKQAELRLAAAKLAVLESCAIQECG